MIITREQAEFRPITIRLETEIELLQFRQILGTVVSLAIDPEPAKRILSDLNIACGE